MNTPHARPADPNDLTRIVEMVAEHAAYEKSGPPPVDLAERLAVLLFKEPSPRLRCLVAVSAGGGVVGYATCVPEISTWDGFEYLHMDCLFLRDDARGQGLGALLMDAVAAMARELCLSEIQWQTPSWNEGAIRFYERQPGVRSTQKLRFTLPVTG